MPSVDAPCFLLPHGSKRSPVYVCIPVDADIANRSPVIEALMEFEGLSVMPAGVSVEDFEAWAALNTDHPSELSDRELSFALQVSEKLSAHDTEGLTQEMAERLQATPWDCCDLADSMLQAILPLNWNLQQLVFQRTRIWSTTLLEWPLELGQAYAGQWVSRKHEHFNIFDRHTAAAIKGIISMLSRTDPALPRLGSLSLRCPIPTTATATLLCDALTHHSSLSRLDLHSLSWLPGAHSTPAEKVFRTLPQLTALTRLAVACSVTCAVRPSDAWAAHVDAVSDSVAALAAAISSLPHLASFHLHNQPPPTFADPAQAHKMAVTATHDDAQVPAKRRRIATYIGPVSTRAAWLSLDPVIAALSDAPALTELYFAHTVTNPNDNLPCSGIHGRFAHLQQLALSLRHGEGSGGVLCALCPTSSLLHIAPLPALQHLEISILTAADDGGFCEGLLRSASRQPALRSISVELAPGTQHSRMHDETRYNLSGVEVRNVDGRSCCEGLHLSVDVHGPVTARCLRSVTTGLTCLTALHGFTVFVEAKESGNVVPDCSAEGFDAVLQPLRGLTQLQSVDVIQLYGSGGAALNVRSLSRELLSGPLQSLVRLTELSLDFGHEGISTSILGDRLSGLTALRVISVGHLWFQEACELSACFGRFTALTSLVICTFPVNDTVVRCFIEGTADLLQLQSAELAGGIVGSACEDSDWMEGLVHVVPRGEYVFGVSSAGVSADAVARVTAQLTARGAKVAVEPDGTTIKFGISECDTAQGVEDVPVT